VGVSGVNPVGAQQQQPGRPHHTGAAAAILLAAGGSTRMGSPKQLLVYEGQPLLRRAARVAIDAGCQPVIAVLGHLADQTAAALSGLPIDIVLNTQWERGIGSSIRTGVERLMKVIPAAPATFLLLADQPLVDPDVLRRLIKARRSSGKPVCASAYAGTIGPPVLVSAELFPRLLALPDDRGAKVLWTGQPDIVATIACDAAAIDLDTPDDWARLSSTGGGS
jgi:molybdenum cofactor cytidylyltransferase